jgi:hypothetical protein
MGEKNELEKLLENLDDIFRYGPGTKSESVQQKEMIARLLILSKHSAIHLVKLEKEVAQLKEQLNSKT